MLWLLKWHLYYSSEGYAEIGVSNDKRCSLLDLHITLIWSERICYVPRLPTLSQNDVTKHLNSARIPRSAPELRDRLHLGFALFAYLVTRIISPSDLSPVHLACTPTSHLLPFPSWPFSPHHVPFSSASAPGVLPLKVPLSGLLLKKDHILKACHTRSLPRKYTSAKYTCIVTACKSKD